MTQAQRIRQQRLAAVLRYVRNEAGRVVPVPPGKKLAPGQVVWLTLDQN